MLSKQPLNMKFLIQIFIQQYHINYPHIHIYFSPHLTFMESLANLLSRTLFTWFVTLVLFSGIFIAYLRLCSQPKTVEQITLPKATVILSLRGLNPFLEKCLRAIAQQNYPQYNIKIILDSLEDPAINLLNQISHEITTPSIELSVLTEIPANCSLKCASLVQAISTLDPDCAVVAFVDPDVVVHPNWLRDLVIPLAPPEIGATTGNCWYLPTGEYWGSWVRYLWNISAVVQMFLYGIAWGGSLAMKTDVIYSTGLLEKWSQAYVEDIPLRSIFGKHKFKVKFVPSALILNRQDSPLPRVIESLQRKLLASRLYHPFWLLVIYDAFFTVVLPNFCLLLIIIALIRLELNTIATLITTYCLYLFGLLLLALTLDREARCVIRTGGEPIPKINLSTVIKMLIATPLTQWVHIWTLLTSLRIRVVLWQGVIYRIYRPWKIRVLHYAPFQSTESHQRNIS